MLGKQLNIVGSGLQYFPICVSTCGSTIKQIQVRFSERLHSISSRAFVYCHAHGLAHPDIVPYYYKMVSKQEIFDFIVVGGKFPTFDQIEGLRICLSFLQQLDLRGVALQLHSANLPQSPACFYWKQAVKMMMILIVPMESVG